MFQARQVGIQRDCPLQRTSCLVQGVACPVGVYQVIGILEKAGPVGRVPSTNSRDPSRTLWCRRGFPQQALALGNEGGAARRIHRRVTPLC